MFKKTLLFAVAAIIFSALCFNAHAAIVTYYSPSGNIETINDNGTVFYFIDEDYWGASIPQGRIYRIDYPETDPWGRDYYTFSYYGDTNVISGRHEETDSGSHTNSFYNETYYTNDLLKKDSSGNVYEAGKIWNGAAQSWDICVRKLTSSGSPVWEQVYGSSADWDCPRAIDLDPSGNVVVVDQSNLLRKFSASDGSVLLTQSFGMGFSPEDIIVDANGDIFMTGVGYNSETGKWELCKTVKCAANGNVLWEQIFDGPNAGEWDSGQDIYIDENGNVVVEAWFTNIYDETEGHRLIYNKSGALQDHYWCENGFPWGGFDGFASRTGRRSQYSDGSYEEHNLLFYKDVILTQSVTDFSPLFACPATLMWFFDDDFHNVVAFKAFTEDPASIMQSAEFTVTTDQGSTVSMQLTKAEYYNGNTAWFLWGTDVYGTEDNVVIERSGPIGSEVWNAYTFDPDVDDPIRVADSAGWASVGTVSDPGSLALPELGDWNIYCLENGVVPECPAMSYEILGGGSVYIAYNPQMTTIYTYGPGGSIYSLAQIDRNGFWVRTAKYNPDGTLYCQWLADPNPGVVGDFVYVEYDASGAMVMDKSKRDMEISESFGSGEYFPLEDGSTWRYNDSLGGIEVTSRIIDDGVIGGVLGLEYMGDPGRVDYFSNNNGAGLSMYGLKSYAGQDPFTAIFDSGSPLSILPANFGVGTHVESRASFSVDGEDFDVDSTTDVIELISRMQFGGSYVYGVLKVEALIHVYSNTGVSLYEKRVMWLKSGVGILKMDLYQGDDPFDLGHVASVSMTDHSAVYDSGFPKKYYNPYERDTVYTFYNEGFSDRNGTLFGRVYSMSIFESSGSSYQGTESATYAYLLGTDTPLIEHESSVMNGIGGTMHNFYNSASDDGPFGVFIEFDSTESPGPMAMMSIPGMVSPVTAEYRPAGEDQGKITKVGYSDGSTAWFLWDAVGGFDAYTVIKYSYDEFRGVWDYSYHSFEGLADIDNPEMYVIPFSWSQYDGGIPEWSIDILPELGSWDDWNNDHYIAPEYPPVASRYYYESGDSSDYYDYDQYGRLSYIENENPWYYNNYEYCAYYEFDWNNSGDGQVGVWYGDDDWYWYKAIYNNGEDYDVSNFLAGEWAKYSETFYDWNYNTYTRTYDVSTGSLYLEEWYDNGIGEVVETKEYWPGGTRVRYRTILDPDGIENGDIVGWEYDVYGNPVSLTYDNGTTEAVSGSYDPDEFMVSGRIDSGENRDLVIDFGDQYGVWVRYNNADWQQLHSLSPESMTLADMDDSGIDDIIFDFGDQYGIWIYSNNTDWQHLHSISPKSVASSDLDNNGQEDVVMDFGDEYGIWVYQNNSSWWQLHSVSAKSIVSADLNNYEGEELVVDFGPEYGIWIWADNSGWSQLHNISAESIVSSDIDGNGQDNLVIDFGAGYGIWVFGNDNEWSQLHTVSSKTIISAALDDNGQEDLVIDFGDEYGIWIYANNSTWTQLHTVSACGITASDIDGNGQDDLVIDFGAEYGIWIYNNNSNWTQLHTVSPAAQAEPVIPQSIYLPRGDEELITRMSLESTLTQDNAGTNYTQVSTLANPPVSEGLISSL
jgi:hypothetical protein